MEAADNITDGRTSRLFKLHIIGFNHICRHSGTLFIFVFIIVNFIIAKSFIFDFFLNITTLVDVTKCLCHNPRYWVILDWLEFKLMVNFHR